MSSVDISATSRITVNKGHALQTLLSRTEHQCIAGTRVPLDFVEIFSTLMEFFVYDPNICTKFSAHYITGEVFCKCRAMLT